MDGIVDVLFLISDSNFVLGNAQVPPSYPIVYCSDGFCELTGYPRAQIMQKGCACKFLYGSETEERGKEDIADALFDKTELKLEIQLYKKGGNAFNYIYILVGIDIGITSIWCILPITELY